MYVYLMFYPFLFKVYNVVHINLQRKVTANFYNDKTFLLFFFVFESIL